MAKYKILLVKVKRNTEKLNFQNVLGRNKKISVYMAGHISEKKVYMSALNKFIKKWQAIPPGNQD